ncbi:hypothetical protein IFM89_032944 [Coptis chinensis]|uniref:Uncharacterized protein n=1 Tax=Coptis chinensis TaxID=261450 RepID=A0A835M2B7_9MAGN|nr:hypothetical protein IFM89_032944 [Coptis chinensis]
MLSTSSSSSSFQFRSLVNCHFTMSSFWIIAFSILAFSFAAVKSDPQTNLLNRGCSQYNVTSPSSFMANLNATFSGLRSQLSNDSNRFATAQAARGADPVYAMVQCRNYLNRSDCLECYAAAETQIRNCSLANGARVIYDGCFLRYESNDFFDQTTLPGNVGICGNRTVSQGNNFGANVGKLLSDLVAATPRINGFFAASNVTGGGTDVYAIAQCARTVSQTGCTDCLKVAYTNIESCPPDSEGRAVDAGCFLRYSDRAFFSSNQTTDLTSFLGKGGSNNKKAIIWGVVGGVIALLLFAVGFIIWFRRKPMRERRGDILGATELRGPVNFKYKDLISATKNFNEQNKLGEGGFGDVYKGTLKNGKIVAVKKLAIGQSVRAKADFESEVKLISNVHHRNLIRLLGCCNKRQELLLVYEYMANKSLDKFLFGIYILLIYPYYFFDRQAGYTAPEYAIHGQLSTKVDTYSYGVVVLEIVSGRKSNDVKLEPITQYLLEWAWKLYEDGMLMDLVDESLDSEEYEVEQVKKVIEIALLCTQSSVVSRPTMSEVVVLLLSKGYATDTPTRPTFIDATKRVRGDKSTSTGSSTSNATISMTEASGR